MKIGKSRFMFHVFTFYVFPNHTGQGAISLGVSRLMAPKQPRAGVNTVNVMEATPEQRIARALWPLLGTVAGGVSFVEKPEIRDVLIGLEYFLPPSLAEVYPYWKGESLDGFHLSEVREIGLRKVEMRGVCILISDQAITPFHMRMQISASGNEINWMECRLGKSGNGKGNMERIPWSKWHDHLPKYLRDSLKPVDWAYQVTFGEEYYPS